MPWTSWLNAEIYDRFVREQSIYDWLNHRLVERAELRQARRVLDLGCGTGATVLACLPHLPSDGEIVGIDASEAMVGVARANVLDPRVRFEVMPAIEVDRLGIRFDSVVCNAAFWQFPAARPVFEALGRTMEAGAPLVFSVPADRVVGQSAPIHPFQVSLMQEIESELGRRLNLSADQVDPGFLRGVAAEHGLAFESTERLVYGGRQGELMELMTIPAMIDPLTTELREARREALLSRVRERSDPNQAVEVPWIYFRFRRSGQPPAAGSS